MIQMIEMKCPSCGANLSVEKEREMMYCDYCGAKIMLCNDHEYIYRRIDEAKIKKAETDRMVRMRELDLEMERQQQKKRKNKIKGIASIVLAILGIICILIGCIGMYIKNESIEILTLVGFLFFLIIMCIWIASDDQQEMDIPDGRVRVPDIAINASMLNYKAIKVAFDSAGFNNIKCVPLGNITFLTGWLLKPNMTESVTINGKKVITKGEKFDPDAKVVITYYSRSEK